MKKVVDKWTSLLYNSKCKEQQTKTREEKETITMTGYNHELKWNVNTSGTKVHESVVKIEGVKYVFTITKYNGKLYTEIWEGSYCIHFTESMD